MRRALAVRRQVAADSRAESFLRPFVAAGALCFDVGANVGQVSGVLLRLGARVVAVEPNPDAVLALRLAFGWTRRLRVVRAAVTDRPGTSTLYRGAESPLSTTAERMREWVREVDPVIAGSRWTNSIAVDATTMDRLASEYGSPAFAKVDVEGGEPEVLRGMSFAPRLVQFEYVPSLGSDLTECVRRFGELAGSDASGSVSPANQYSPGAWVDLDTLSAELARTHSTSDVFLRS